MDDPGTLGARDFAEAPRTALMWPPRARDVARFAAAARAAARGARPRVLDAGAGSGLLARLLADAGCDVEAVDAFDADAPPPGVGRFFPVRRARVETLEGGFDAAVVSWMEAGRDYRAAVARLAPVVLQAYDPEGGCGVRGDTGYAAFGFARVAEWRTPSYEDVAHARRTRGRAPGGAGLARAAGPGNVLEALAREGVDARRVAEAVDAATSDVAYPWESELAALGL